jgi:GT2 family glycosyltransferase
LLGAAPREVPAATFDCCVLPRLALEGVGGFTRRYLGTDEKGIDAALKLCRSGLNSYWVPEVEMIHPQGGASGERNWCKLVSSLDSRVFDDQWARVLPSLVESA